ncbi:MAG: N-acetylmuramoyl-L-alanine amidase [Gaiellaceae bacterium]
MREVRHRTSRRSFLLGGLVLALPLKAASAARSKRKFDGLGRADEIVSRVEPLLSSRSLQSGFRTMAPRRAPRFSMVGLHWRGGGEVHYRVASGERVFGKWHRAECCEQPDVGSGEPAPRPGWHFGKPAWTADSEWIQYRVRGDIRALRAHFLWSEPQSLSGRQLAIADGPALIPRGGWGANERIVRAEPYYAEKLELALVHHTAGKRPGTRAQSAAIVKAIQRFHINVNGWNDIGYNFLVDPFGQIFEGRGGGIETNVVGAHARGFNRGAVGIALLGDHHTGGTPTPEALAALTALVAWRLDVAHLDPATLRGLTSGGTGLHPPNASVTLRSVSGHRDTDFTSCPGNHLYPHLDAVAVNAAATGLPKLYDPAVEGLIGAPVRFSARLSEELPWAVTVVDAAGTPVALGEGLGAAVDWTWDATLVSEGGPFSYSITAGETVRGVSGLVEEPPPPPPPPDPEALPEPPPKPKGVPKRVPAWAWEMYRWHDQARANRGPRPEGAPKRLPRWYWKWRRWRLQHAKIAKLIRIRREAGEV